MNKKSSISKVLNAKHVKILEELLRLPENRECADCKNKAPRWASINLGIFICLQCSGIHRSLGVHISKVRSSTLDTWLPEQVAFMQSMGNEKSNAYWEAELPLHYDRSRYEIFIPTKYVERKWVPKDGKVKPSPKSEEELAYPSLTTSTNHQIDMKEHSVIEKQSNSIEELASNQSLTTASRKSSSIPDFGTNQHTERTDCLIVGRRVEGCDNHEVQKYSAEDRTIVGRREEGRDNPEVQKYSAEDRTTNVDPEKDLQKTKGAVSEDYSATAKLVPFPKVDYATELFRMLCVDDSAESDLSPSSDISTWVDFDTDEEETIQKKVVQGSSTSKVHPEPKVEDVITSLVPETKGYPQKPQKDKTNHDHFHPEEPKKTSASSVYRGQVVTPAKGGSYHTEASKISYPDSQTHLHSIQRHVDSSQVPSLDGRRSVDHLPGTQLPMLSIPPAKFAGNTAPCTSSSLNRPAMPLNGMLTAPARRPPAALPISGYDYDFSFLTQGMFTK